MSLSDEDVPTPRRALSLPRFKKGAFSLTELDDSRAPSPEFLETPTLYETGVQVRKNLSFATLKELDPVQLRARLWKEAKPSGKRPKDFDQVIAWAIRGGTRSFLLAFTARASFNTVLLLLNVVRRKKLSMKALLTAILGETNVRFGAMLGLFSALYRFLFHSLRLYNPGPRGFGKEERWHAPLAGAISSLALFAERKEARLALSQQVFVRGLQGLYHRFRARGLHILHGDILLFGLACGQIMYSWLMNPVALARAYQIWITDASNVPRPLASIQRARAWGEPLPIPAAKNILETWRKTTSNNTALMRDAIDRARLGDNGPPFSICSFNHPSSDSCIVHWLKLWPTVWRWMLPVYAGLHYIPPLILRRKAFLREPNKYLYRATMGTFYSSAFLATFVFIYQSSVCSQRHIYYYLSSKNYKALAKASTHPYFAWVFGFMTCLSLFWEEKRRREELALYVLPKALESFWKTLRMRRLAPQIPHGELWLNAAGLAIIMDTFQREREALSAIVSSILWQTVSSAA